MVWSVGWEPLLYSRFQVRDTPPPSEDQARRVLCVLETEAALTNPQRVSLRVFIKNVASQGHPQGVRLKKQQVLTV